MAYCVIFLSTKNCLISKGPNSTTFPPPSRFYMKLYHHDILSPDNIKKALNIQYKTFYANYIIREKLLKNALLKNFVPWIWAVFEFTDSIVCSRPEDGLRCRQGIKPPLKPQTSNIACQVIVVLVSYVFVVPCF